MELEIGQKYKIEYKNKIVEITPVKKNKTSYRVEVNGEQKTLWFKDKYYFSEVEYRWGRGQDIKVYVEFLSEAEADRRERILNIQKCDEVIKKYDAEIAELNEKMKEIQDRLHTLYVCKQLKEEKKEKYKEGLNG